MEPGEALPLIPYALAGAANDQQVDSLLLLYGNANRENHRLRGSGADLPDRPAPLPGRAAFTVGERRTRQLRRAAGP
jgi:hypothetical protein